MSEMDTLNGILNPTSTPAQAAPVTETAPAAPAAATDTVPETSAPATSTEGTADTTPSDTPATPPQTETETDPEQIFSGSKQNQAFAQMRVQNKQLLSTVSRLSQVMGIPPNLTPDQVLPLIEQRLTEIEAQANNIPVDIARRLEEAERQRQEQDQAMLRNNATLAFQKVKDTYGLTQTQLVEFAQQLNTAGKNPYQQPVDLVQEYRMLNYDTILENERRKAAQAEIERMKKADAQSTTPPKASGPASESPKPISTVTDLNAWLSKQ